MMTKQQEREGLIAISAWPLPVAWKMLYDFMTAAKDRETRAKRPLFFFLERLANEEKYRTELPAGLTGGRFL